MADEPVDILTWCKANLPGEGPYRPQEAVLKAMADPGVVTHVSFRPTFTLKAFEDHGDGSWTAFFREAGLLGEADSEDGKVLTNDPAIKLKGE